VEQIVHTSRSLIECLLWCGELKDEKQQNISDDDRIQLAVAVANATFILAGELPDFSRFSQE